MMQMVGRQEQVRGSAFVHSLYVELHLGNESHIPNTIMYSILILVLVTQSVLSTNTTCMEGMCTEASGNIIHAVLYDTSNLGRTGVKWDVTVRTGLVVPRNGVTHLCVMR